MAMHMLVQLPLLAAIGYGIGAAWREAQGEGGRRMLGHVQAFNAGGATGLIAAAFVMLAWMLPRWLMQLAAPMALKSMSTRLPVSNARARHELGWRPRFPSYREGLAQIARDLASEPTAVPAGIHR